MKIRIIFILFLLCSQSLFSKDGYNHIRDMQDVIGIEYNNNINSLFKSITETIDKGAESEFYKNLQNQFPYITIGSFTDKTSNKNIRYGIDLSIIGDLI